MDLRWLRLGKNDSRLRPRARRVLYMFKMLQSSKLSVIRGSLFFCTDLIVSEKKKYGSREMGMEKGKEEGGSNIQSY